MHAAFQLHSVLSTQSHFPSVPFFVFLKGTLALIIQGPESVTSPLSLMVFELKINSNLLL